MGRRFEAIPHLSTFGYNKFMVAIKPLRWMGSAKRDLAAMPDEVQDVFGYALHLAQVGGKHRQSKPLTGFGGPGVLEVIEDHQGDTYRAVYTVRFAAAVYVLHCFQKKSKHGISTPKPDIDLISARLKAAASLEKDR
jgi:phage-related protein